MTKKEDKKRYADFDDAFLVFLSRNCVPATTDWDVHELPYIQCDIKITMNSSGGGYIHLLGQDSDTIDFATMNHYKLTGTPKPKHLL